MAKQYILQTLWQCEYRIPDHLIDTVPASLGRTKGLKLPRYCTPQIGTTITDRARNKWKVIDVDLFGKDEEDKGTGKHPIVIVELKTLAA